MRSACRELSAQRQAPARPQWVSVLLDGARDALGREGAPAAGHGALLALLALLPHAAPGAQLHAAFDVACDGVRRQLLLRKSTDLLLAALALLPALAAALPAEFAAERLPDLLRLLVEVVHDLAHLHLPY